VHISTFWAWCLALILCLIASFSSKKQYSTPSRFLFQHFNSFALVCSFFQHFLEQNEIRSKSDFFFLRSADGRMSLTSSTETAFIIILKIQILYLEVKNYFWCITQSTEFCLSRKSVLKIFSCDKTTKYCTFHNK